MDTPKFNNTKEQLKWVCRNQQWLYDLVLENELCYRDPKYTETLEETQDTVYYYENEYDGDQFEQQVQATDWEREHYW